MRVKLFINAYVYMSLYRLGLYGGTYVISVLDIPPTIWFLSAVTCESGQLLLFCI